MPTTNLLLVGLGNPGNQYSASRHNIGFMVIDHWLQVQKLAVAWQLKPSSASLLAQIKINSHNIKLLKPQTFMNDSGKSVAETLRFFKLTTSQLWVIHDDLDLPLGTVRLSYGASAAGHKGVQSIIDYLGSNTWSRCRIGIGRPSSHQSAEDYVLRPFRAKEKSILKLIFPKTAELIDLISQGMLTDKVNNLTFKLSN